MDSSTHIELDLEPTKRVQNFGGGLGPAGGGRHAHASKSINLQIMGSLAGINAGLGKILMENATPINEAVDSSGPHDISGFDVGMYLKQHYNDTEKQ